MVVSLQDGPNLLPPGILTFRQFPFTLSEGWPVIIVLPEVTACHFPDEVTKDRGFHLGYALSLITCSGGSQLPGLEVTEAAL